MEWSFDDSGWKIFAHKVLKCCKQILKNTFPKLLGWTHCRLQISQPFWKPFAQRPEVFRPQSESFSQNIYFGHVESNLDNPAEKLHLKLRKVLKKIHLDNVPSDLKTRSYGNPPNKGTQKAVLTNVWKNNCWKPTKRSINLLPKNDSSDINDWVLTTLRTFTEQSPKVLRSDSERKITEAVIWTRWKQFWQLSPSFLVQTGKIVQKTISEQRFLRQVEKSFDKPTRNFLLEIQESSAQNQKTFSGSFRLDTFNSVHETLGKPFTQSWTKIYTKNGTALKFFYITPTYL